MKKVLFMLTSLYNGGAERSLVNLLNELPKDQYSIDLLLFKREGLFLNQLPDYVHILETPAEIQRLYGSLKNSGAYLPAKLLGNIAARICEKEDRRRRAFRWDHCYSKLIPMLEGEYDVAVAYISGEILFYVDEKVNAKRKLVWIHNDYRAARHPKEYDYRHLKNMDAIVSISDKCVNIMKEEFPEFSDRTYMLENITSSAFVRSRAQAFFPEEFQNFPVNILSVGRLTPQKGFDLAIRAAGLVKKHGFKFRWFIIGNGKEQKTLEKLIEEQNVADSFFLIGPRDNPYAYMNHCTLIAQTSRFEGKSMVLDEAKIIGTPILATDYSTVSDQILSGQEGIIVGMTPEEIASGIESLLSHPERLDEIRCFLQSHEYGNQYLVNQYCRLFDN